MLPYVLQMLLSLWWGDYPGLTGWVQCSHKSPFKEKKNHGNREEMEQCSLKMKEGAMSQGMQAACL